MSKKLSIIAFGCAVAWLVSGCSSVMVGSAPDKNPPKLLKAENVRGLDKGKVADVQWDRPIAFGPVPTNLQVVGDAACQAGGFAKAIGYHPSAIGLDGKAIAGGGYFCSNS
ncbi:MAG: hypothetical protein QJT81_09765 [Candidatus Thiothrix putei]|uniref:Uncharacterized protein n=1 Tax=Candidatus Thiothrix putei TaxID=3080811 RepID=A0AA95HLJ1_9GAMM|nr:MAG: hypothetical protein QJT81_09765 [Candidatus Thiothrix putei]